MDALGLVRMKYIHTYVHTYIHGEQGMIDSIPSVDDLFKRIIEVRARK